MSLAFSDACDARFAITFGRARPNGRIERARGHTLQSFSAPSRFTGTRSPHRVNGRAYAGCMQAAHARTAWSLRVREIREIIVMAAVSATRALAAPILLLCWRFTAGALGFLSDRICLIV
jgi:hypothetical protein